MSVSTTTKLLSRRGDELSIQGLQNLEGETTTKTASLASEMLKTRPDQAGKIFIKMLIGAEPDEKKSLLLAIANSPYRKMILEQILLQEGKLL